MALYKDILQDDGVTTSYHRILYIQTTVNRQISIAVLSYVGNESRESAKETVMSIPYQKAITYELPYNEEMTVTRAYGYLKTLPQFEGAEDV